MRIETRRELFEWAYVDNGVFSRTRIYDLAPDGRFVMLRQGAAGQDDEDVNPIILVQNWLIAPMKTGGMS